MELDELVSANDFCLNHNISISFIHSLQEYGLVELTVIEKSLFIPTEKLIDIERLVRLHYDLDINMEGIDVVTQLLGRIKEMQDEMKNLKNRLGLYEPDDRKLGLND
jgi:hypothetical protein